MAKKVNRYRVIQEKTYAFVLNKMKLSKKDELYWDIKDAMDETDHFWTESFDEFYNFSGRDKRNRIIKGSDYEGELFEITLEMVMAVYNGIRDYYGDSWNFEPGYTAPRLKMVLSAPDKDVIKLMKTL
jgi:hypothetical protein